MAASLLLARPHQLACSSERHTCAPVQAGSPHAAGRRLCDTASMPERRPAPRLGRRDARMGGTALRLQALWRGAAARRRFLRARAAAVALQAAWRGARARAGLRRALRAARARQAARQAAAVAIQRHARGVAARAALRRARLAAVAIQARLRARAAGPRATALSAFFCIRGTARVHLHCCSTRFCFPGAAAPRLASRSACLDAAASRRLR